MTSFPGKLVTAYLLDLKNVVIIVTGFYRKVLQMGQTTDYINAKFDQIDLIREKLVLLDLEQLRKIDKYINLVRAEQPAFDIWDNEKVCSSDDCQNVVYSYGRRGPSKKYCSGRCRTRQYRNDKKKSEA